MPSLGLIVVITLLNFARFICAITIHLTRKIAKLQNNKIEATF